MGFIHFIKRFFWKEGFQFQYYCIGIRPHLPVGFASFSCECNSHQSRKYLRRIPQGPYGPILKSAVFSWVFLWRTYHYSAKLQPKSILCLLMSMQSTKLHPIFRNHDSSQYPRCIWTTKYHGRTSEKTRESSVFPAATHLKQRSFLVSLAVHMARALYNLWFCYTLIKFNVLWPFCLLAFIALLIFVGHVRVFLSILWTRAFIILNSL